MDLAIVLSSRLARVGMRRSSVQLKQEGRVVRGAFSLMRWLSAHLFFFMDSYYVYNKRPHKYPSLNWFIISPRIPLQEILDGFLEVDIWVHDVCFDSFS